MKTEEFFNNWAIKNVEVKGGNPKTYELRPEQIFKCMQEYADQSQEPKQREVSEAVDVDWDKLREKFFLDCVDTTYVNKYTPSLRKVNYAPHDLFEWFKDNLFKSKTE